MKQFVFNTQIQVDKIWHIWVEISFRLNILDNIFKESTLEQNQEKQISPW